MPTGTYVRRPRKDYAGWRFGNLTVLWAGGWRGKDRRIQWVCQCDCGNVNVVCSGDLKRGLTRSCGCKKLVRHNVNARNLFAQYRHKAKARGIPWVLTFEQFLTITQQPCYFTGWLPKQTVHKKARRSPPYVYNGIDRLDNRKGYTLDNAVACNGDVNKAKLAMTEARFVAMCCAVASKRGGSNGKK